MSEPVRQHYVPQTYLKHFSFDINSPWRIYVLHKRKRKITSSSIRDAAVERHFYTVKKHEDNYIWEKYYADNIEPLMDSVISKILKTCDSALLQNYTSIITAEMKEQIAVVIISQLLRGKHSRDLEKKFYNKALPGVMKRARELFGPLDEKNEMIIKDFEDKDDYFKLVSMETTLNIDSLKKYVDILLQRAFVVFKILGDQEFVTSDNPVMLVDANSLDATPFKNGLAQHSTVVYFPISPRIIIAAYPPNLFLGLLNEYNGKFVFIDSHQNSNFIKMHNSKQFEQCYDQVYAKGRQFLESLSG